MKKRIIKPIIVSCLLILLVFTGCRLNEITGTTQERATETESTNEFDLKITERTPKITFDQIRKIERDMTYREVIEILGVGEDIGSGIHIYLYQTEDGMPFLLSVPGESGKIGKSGEELIEEMNKKD